jgi:crotonobetainyl-CoA:carnitine CoA-transferase CaiB-like acyl-CoA transferase
VLEREELCTDERFRTNAGRTRNRDVLVPELAAAIKRFDTGTLIAKLHANGIPGGELRTVAEAFASEEAKARDAVMAAPDPQLGEVRMVRSPLRMSGSPTTTPIAPPTLGQHTREVLGKVLDYSPERIDALEREGAIRCGD